MRLKGKIATITGAGQGIGRSIAEWFAREGAQLVLNDLPRSIGRNDLERLGPQVAEVELVRGEVSLLRVARQHAAAALERYGRIDVLVNNAGIGSTSHGDGPVTESQENSWDKILPINLKSIFLCCRYAIPEMARDGAAR